MSRILNRRQLTATKAVKASQNQEGEGPVQQSNDVNPGEDSHAPLIVPPTGSDPDVVSEQNLKPFRTIWLRPRETIRRIVAVNPDLNVLLLVCLAGIGQALDRASNRNLGDRTPMAMIICFAIVLGPLGGYSVSGLGRTCFDCLVLG